MKPHERANAAWRLAFSTTNEMREPFDETDTAENCEAAVKHYLRKLGTHPQVLPLLESGFNASYPVDA